MESLLVGFVGAGSAARALAGAVAAVKPGRVKVSVAGFHSRGSASARNAARALGPGVRAVDDLARLAEMVDILLVAVPDRALDGVAAELTRVARRGLVIAHLAGARGRDALAACARRGAAVAAFHPIQTFPGGPLDASRVRGSFVAIEGDARARALLRRLALTLGMHPFELPAANRALYHASAVLASNAVVSLFDIATRVFAEATRLPVSSAERALRPLFSATAENLVRLGIPAALSGPVARGDLETLRRHCQALRTGPGRAAAAYAILGAQAVDVARRKGSLTPKAAAAMRAFFTGLPPAGRAPARPAGRRRVEPRRRSH